MKIVCEACQAKYSISDDKVRGKAFKIRCKKCSHIIVVRGTGDGATASPQPETVSGVVDAGWHVVVEGAQVGPLTEADIQGRLSRGELTGETYIWREGLADWQKISAVPEFSGFAVGPLDPAESGASFSSPAPSGYAGAPSDGGFGATFGAARDQQEPDVFAAPTVVGGSQTADLFSSPMTASAPEQAPTSNGSPFSFGGGHGSSHGAEAAHRGASTNGAGASPGRVDGLTAQRHENSVLFSLSNLEALAAPAPVSAAPRPGISTSSSSEGSGLIDIRSMAAMTLGGSSGSGNESRSFGSDLPAFAAPQFSPVAPVLLPMAGSSGPPKWVYPLFGLLLVAVVGLGFASLKVWRDPGTSAVATPAVVPAPAPAVAAPAPAAPAGAAPAVTPPPAVDEKLPPREEPKAAVTAERPARDKGDKRSPKGGRDAKKPGKQEPERTAAAVAAAPKAEEKAAPSKPKDSIDSLLEQAMGTKSKPAARTDDDDSAGKRAEKSAPSASAGGPAALAKLEKGDIVRAMSGVAPKVKDCYNQYKVPGVAEVNVSVARGGKVNGVTVRNKFAGTPTGSCVESAVRSAKFPPSDAMNFPYSFSLR